MTIDLACIGILLFFGLVGAASGAVKQVIHLVGIAAGWLAAHLFAAAAGHALGASLPPLVARAAASLALFWIAFGLVHAVGYAVVRRTPLARATHGGADRGLGVLLGAAKAAGILWVLLSALVFLDGPIRNFGWRFDDAGSDFARLAREHNAFATSQFPQVKPLRALLRAWQDPAALARLKDDPDVKPLLSDPRLAKLLADPQAARAAGVEDDLGLLRSQGVLELLQDPQLAKRLELVRGKVPSLPPLTEQQLLDKKREKAKRSKSLLVPPK